jgi:hypothetical protein
MFVNIGNLNAKVAVKFGISTKNHDMLFIDKNFNKQGE